MRDEILEKFKDRAICPGGIWMFKASDAMDIIEEGNLIGLSILGLDGFFVTEKSTTPSVENSVDYSAGDWFGINIKEAAVEFLRKRHNTEMYFEVIFK